MEALESKTYTTEKTLAERMNERLAELHMTKAEAAMRMNYSRSAVSQYLNGKYASDPTEIEKKITEFLIASGDTEGIPEAQDTTEDTGVKLKSKVEFFESRDFINTIGVCQACQENIGLGIIVGKSGQGKTHALKKYAKLQRVAYIECDDTMACRDLVEAIEMELGMPRSTGGTIWSRVNRIREFFNVNQGYLLIIDEADKLINKYTQKKMEILRGIFDQSDVGIVIAGEPRLETELKSSLTRFANRMDFYYKLKGLNQNEVKDYLEGFEIDEAAMGELISRATNNNNGCFRLLDRTLNNVLRVLRERGETKVTLKIVSEASSMMMLYLAQYASTDGVKEKAQNIITNVMKLPRDEMNTLYKDSIISALCEIENYRKTVFKAPTEDMELSGDKVIMAGNITVEVKNVKGE